MAPATIWNPPEKPQRSKKFRKLLVSIFGCFALVYGVGALHFSQHFTPGTTVDGIDARQMTTAQLAEALTERTNSYEQHLVYGDGFDMTFTGADIGLTFDAERVANQAREQTNPLLWLPYLVAPRQMLIDGNIQANEETLTKKIDEAIQAYNKEAEQPTNATATYNAEKHEFEVTPDAVGTALTTEEVVKQSLVGCKELAPTVTISDDALLQPTVTADDKQLNKSVKEANEILAKPIDVQADGNTVKTIDADTMASWMHLDDERKLVIEGVYKWIEESPEIVDAGNAIDEEHVWALDTQGTCDAIHAGMDSKSGDPVEIVRYVLEQKPAATPGAKERGRHIDINLSTQFARFYDSDGKVIWDSYCVTGGWDYVNGIMHSTPTGTFAIESKQTGITLIGADLNNDQQPDYESYVNYWMPFLNNDVGLHDATWRYDDGFGGDVYTYYGSHGCVNLPYSKAEELFNLVQVGDEVYVHD